MTSEKILIVHWQETFIDRCTSWLASEGFEVEVAYTGREALEALEREVFSLMVTALELSDFDGVELLRQLREEHATQTPALVLATKDLLSVGLVNGLAQLSGVEVIAQPTEAAPFLESLWRVWETDLATGVRGDLRTLNLPSLITLLCNEGLQAALHLEGLQQRAHLYFEKGRIVHAETAGQIEEEGEEAVHEALTWNEGRFWIVAGEAPAEQTIYASWTHVLLEGLQLADEADFDQEQLPPEGPLELPDLLGADEDFDVESLPPAPRTPTFSVSDAQQQRAEERVQSLYQSLKPRFVLLTDRSGRLVTVQGQVEHTRALSLAALVAGSFSATAEIAEMVAHEGEERRFQQSLHESEEFSLYAAQAGTTWILALAFEPDRTNLGLVRLYVLRTASDLTEILLEESSPEYQQDVGQAMNDLFRKEVGNALEDLFG
jgi:CheY-like chemotaxis protein/predicted regulator of Ras-like GTPase activity (Roadblock/LC7/MglB family)